MSIEDKAIAKGLKRQRRTDVALDGVGFDKDYVLRRGTDLRDLAGLLGGDCELKQEE